MENTRQLNSLETIPVGEVRVFHSPIEGPDNLVRTGTITNDSLLHSVLYAHSTEYIRMKNRDRESLVSKVKKQMATDMEDDIWNETSKSESVHLSFTQIVRDSLRDFYNNVLNNKKGKTSCGRKLIRKVLNSSKDRDTFSILFQILSEKQLNEIINEIMKICSNDLLITCMDGIEERLIHVLESHPDLEQLNSSKRKKCIDKLSDFVHMVLELSEKIVKKENKQSFTLTVNNKNIEYISNRYEVDIYFIESNNRLPIHINDKQNIRGRKSVIIMCIDDKYEVVGRLFNKNKVQREFYNDDPLIERIRIFLYNPSKVKRIYPDLVNYLPDTKLNGSRSEKSSISEEKDSDYSDYSDYGRQNDSIDYSGSNSSKSSRGSKSHQESSKSHQESSSRGSRGSRSRSRSSSRGSRELGSRSRSRSSSRNSRKLNSRKSRKELTSRKSRKELGSKKHYRNSSKGLRSKKDNKSR